MPKNIFIIVMIMISCVLLSSCATQKTSSSNQLASTSSTSPSHIALLLPLQGNMGQSGRAIRDGFLSAYYESLATTHLQQIISFYDTSQNPNIVALYEQAIAKGANRVVGPLIKKDVETLLQHRNFPVPTLALNYTDLGWRGLPTNLYEFGLSPLDEAQQIAEKAKQDGKSRALVIASQSPSVVNTTKALIARWQSLGGSMSDTLYFTSQTDFTTAIASLLHVNSANDHKQTNKAILEQQRRQDFDVIFLLAEPQSARQIVPLLRYYYVENIPIYATSSIYVGTLSSQKDSDLNGVIFCDIPWLLNMSHSGSSNRLYAVGRDAYLISNQLPNVHLSGATGELTLTATHQIYRRLSWATMHNGHP